MQNHCSNWNQVLIKNLTGININKKSKHQNPHWDYLTNPSFQGKNGFFALSFPDNRVRARQTEYFVLSVEIKDCNVMIDGQKLWSTNKK